MRRNLIALTTMPLAFAVVGCSLAGSWRVIATDPPGAPFPVSVVTFDRDHNCTSTWSQAGGARTSVAQYRWNGFNLKIMEAGRLPLTYRARRSLGGGLVLTYRKNDAKVVATLEKVGG